MYKPSIFFNDIRNSTEYNEVRIELLKKELKTLPKGKLVFFNRKTGVQVYEYFDGKRRGIKKDKDRMHALARAEYLRNCINTYETEQYLEETSLKMLKRSGCGFSSEDNEISKCLERLKLAGLDMARVVCSPSQLEWRNHQSMNHNRREELKWPSSRGIMMRSMQETSIDNIFNEYGIPARYEFALKVDVTAMSEIYGAFPEGDKLYKTYYPDFVILLPDGSYIIWEHLGRIDLETYRNHIGEKVCAYLNSGIVAQNRLILTFPSDVSNPSAIHKIIQEKILPYL